MRDRYSQNKLCQRCRDWKKLTQFNSIQHGEHFRKDRICIPCRAIRDAINAQIESEKMLIGKCPAREKELALIPNPFAKQNFVHIQDQSNLLWSECV